MRIKLAEKKAKEEAESKGESSIAINGYLLCKEGLHHTRATAGLLFSVPNIWLQLWCSECEGARDGHMQVHHTHRYIQTHVDTHRYTHQKSTHMYNTDITQRHIKT